MARDILGEYGPESPMDQKPRATNGGKMPVRDVMGYKEPVGPKNRHSEGPGLHDDNRGCCGTQGKY